MALIDLVDYNWCYRADFEKTEKRMALLKMFGVPLFGEVTYAAYREIATGSSTATEYYRILPDHKISVWSNNRELLEALKEEE